MQYLLTKEEYDALKEVQRERFRMADRQLAELCTRIADAMPIPVPVKYKNDEAPSPWGCVVTAAARGEEHYCDECPVQTICPRQKSYSQ